MRKLEKILKTVPHSLIWSDLRPQVIIFFIIFCCLSTPLAIHGEDKTLKSEEDAVQDFSWIKNEYRSKMQNKYGFAYWINGWRKHKEDNSKDLLCLETGNFGIIFDMAALDQPKFSVIKDDSNLFTSMEAGVNRVASLDPAELLIEVEQGGKKYRVKSCKAAKYTPKEMVNHLYTTRTLASGAYVQNNIIEQLYLFDELGTQLGCYGELDIFAWPDTLNFTVELAPEFKHEQGYTQGVKGLGYCVKDKEEVANFPSKEPMEAFSVEFWMKSPKSIFEKGDGCLLYLKGEDFNCRFNRRFEKWISVSGNLMGVPYYTMQNGLLNETQWNHLAATYQGNIFTQYINGKVASSNILKEHRKVNIDTITLGYPYKTASQKPLSTHYDELRIWKKALSANEIKEHYEQPEKSFSSNDLVYENCFEPNNDSVTIPKWTDAKISITLKNKNHSWTNKAEIKGDWNIGEKKKLTLSCNINSVSGPSPDVSIKFNQRDNGNPFPVEFNPEINGYVTHIPLRERDQRFLKPGMYDDFNLEIHNNSSEIKEIKLNIKMTEPFQGTGCVSTLCYPDGTPTGIYVQNAKSYNGTTEFLKPYMLIPVKPGKTTLLYRIAYKYFGTCTSASISNDEVEWGACTKWYQMVIGGPGEMLTLDGDHGLSTQSICDVRTLFLRQGLKGTLNRWTDAGWGGDYLIAKDKNNNKLFYNDMKTVILAHGPCFTDVHFKGFYGSERIVAVDSKVNIVRSDDYARVFFELRYDFQKNLSAKDVKLFVMGPERITGMPKVVYGNSQGLVKEISGSNIYKELHNKNFVIDGQGPWWVTTPENFKTGTVRPFGYSALIVRSVEYRLGGQIYNTPTFGFIGTHTSIVAPQGISEFKSGDIIKINVEWITLPKIADDYYGPNEVFLNHLKENPQSWKTAYREAHGNDLKVKVSGGRLLKNYPLIIKAESPEIRFKIEGGAGYVPLRFEGLESDRGYTLYQIIDNAEVALDQSTPMGNDFWQTDYDAPSHSYKRCYNLRLDNTDVSQWVLKYKFPKGLK